MIKEILKTLNKCDLDALKVSLEQGDMYYIRLPDNCFIGVNIRSMGRLTVTETDGLWQYGILEKT